MDIKQLILDTYTAKPKHFTQILKRNPDVHKYITENVPASITAFLEQLYYIVYQDDGMCKNGNKKQLKSFTGYSFCGKTGVCQCAKDAVSMSVAKAKSQYTEEQSAQINEKRKQTTISRYGVTNNGQTETAKFQHALLYKDPNAVNTIVDKIKATKLEVYGNETYNNREKAKTTCISRYGVENTFLITEDNTNPGLDVLRDKERIVEIFPKLTVKEISETLGVSESTVYRYLIEHGLRVPYKSTFEQELVQYLTELGVSNIVTNNRTIIGKELDIFIPKYNLAIEYNGIFWHHDKIPHITKTYHRDKFKLCEDKGIDLFSIFSDSWESNKEIWKSKIKSKLGLSTEKIYARKTTIVELKASQTREILNNHHIQGYCTSEICYGLIFDHTLVAVMTFSKKRAGIGKARGDNAYELVRYVTSKAVVGGAGKLLQHFIKIHRPAMIFSYSDNRYSTGNLYKTLGFTLENDNNPGYGYYCPTEKKMYHRYNFTKHKLVSQGYNQAKTEFQIMNERGFLRVWDCGTRTWVLDLRNGDK